MKNFTHQTVVRNGNHFIKLQGEYAEHHKGRWMLIDGPWFKYLEKYQYDEVYLAPYQKMVSISIDEDYCLEFIGAEFRRDPTIWVRYERAILGADAHFFAKTGDRDWIYQKFSKYRDLKKDGYLPNVFLNPMIASISFYTVLTWWECNGGILPAWIKNPEWDEDLEELFTYTTYHKYEELE